MKTSVNSEVGLGNPSTRDILSPPPTPSWTPKHSSKPSSAHVPGPRASGEALLHPRTRRGGQIPAPFHLCPTKSSGSVLLTVFIPFLELALQHTRAIASYWIWPQINKRSSNIFFLPTSHPSWSLSRRWHFCWDQLFINGVYSFIFCLKNCISSGNYLKNSP